MNNSQKSVLRTMMKVNPIMPNAVVDKILPLGNKSVFSKSVSAYNPNSDYDNTNSKQSRMQVTGHEFKMIENPNEDLVSGLIQATALTAGGVAIGNPAMISSGINKGISSVNNYNNKNKSELQVTEENVEKILHQINNTKVGKTEKQAEGVGHEIGNIKKSIPVEDNIQWTLDEYDPLLDLTNFTF